MGQDSDFGLHVVVAGAAKLAASEFQIRRALGSELHPLDGAAGDGVLVETEGGHIERVNHIAAAEKDMNRFACGDDQFGGREVVLGGRVVLVHTEFVLQRKEVGGAVTEFAVGSGVAEIPSELVGDDIHGHGIRRNRGLCEFAPHAVSPDRKRQEDRCGNDGPPEFEGVVAVAVVGLVSRAAAVFDEINDINGLGRDKDGEGEPEDEIQNSVDFLTTDGDVFRGPVEVLHSFLGLGGGNGKPKEQEAKRKDSEK